ncbi:MAG TPA: DUF2007 domain-containing protein [Thermoanaerobaculia bacterium]|nr:DUF2007 domain-containing protein [Thermoanaerobaculia bacterium]
MDPALPSIQSQYVPLDRYLSLAEADLARSMLQAAGLEAQVRDEYLAGLNWYYIPAIGGVRLEVPADQWEDAQDLLSAEPDPINQTEEEQAHLEVAKRQRRTLGKVAIALQLFPLVAPVVMGFLLASVLLRKDESPGEHNDE